MVLHPCRWMIISTPAAYLLEIPADCRAPQSPCPIPAETLHFALDLSLASCPIVRVHLRTGSPNILEPPALISIFYLSKVRL